MYLLDLIVLEILPLGNSLMSLKIFAAAPLAVYFVAIILQTLALIPAGGVCAKFFGDAAARGQPCFLCLGFWLGLFTKLNRSGNKPVVEVILENIQS